MTKYMLFTWPSSQPFIGVDGCILLLPPPNDINGSLDSAYMVPTTVAEKINKELLQNGMEVVLPESDTPYTRKPLKKKAKKEDYLDYDGNVFSPVKKKFRLDVIFGEQPSTPLRKERLTAAMPHTNSPLKKTVTTASISLICMTGGSAITERQNPNPQHYQHEKN